MAVVKANRDIINNKKFYDRSVIDYDFYEHANFDSCDLFPMINLKDFPNDLKFNIITKQPYVIVQPKKLVSVDLWKINFNNIVKHKSYLISRLLKEFPIVGSTIVKYILGKTESQSDIDLIYEHEKDINKIIRDVLSKDSFEIKVLSKITNHIKMEIDGYKVDFIKSELNNIPKIIREFHLACVRAVYYKNHLYVYPSFVRAFKYGICCESSIKKYVTIKEQLPIYKKYHELGFGFLLEKKFGEELISLLK